MKQDNSLDKKPFTRQILDSFSEMTRNHWSRISDRDNYGETPQGIAAYLIERGLAKRGENRDNLEL